MIEFKRGSWFKLVLVIFLSILYFIKELTFFEWSVLLFLWIHYENVMYEIKKNTKEDK